MGPVHALAGYLAAYAVLTRLRSSRLHDGVLATMLGVAPDVDYVSPLPFGTPFGHHGLTHSPLLLILVSIPFFAKYGLKASPYFLALMSHIMLDFIDNSVPLLAPFFWEEYGFNLVFTHPFEAYCLQLTVTMVSAYVILRKPGRLQISLPDKYDRLATPALAVGVPAFPFILLFLHEESERVFGYQLQAYPVILVTLVLSSVLILMILMLNSRLITRRTGRKS
ncbi:MAG: metal-dependent hydrolase [Crenarchaeota archaeon]|nr:metal-dependent hydrolase [Thermoproteota archaeon]